MIDIENKLTAQKEVLERIKIRTNNGRKFVSIKNIFILILIYLLPECKSMMNENFFMNSL